MGEHQLHAAGDLLSAFSLLSALPWLQGAGRHSLHPAEQEDTCRQVLLPFLPWGPCSLPSSPFFSSESVLVEGVGRELLTLPCLLPQDPPLCREKASRGSAVQVEMDVCS